MRAAIVRDYSIEEFLESTLNAVGLVNLIVLCDGVAGLDRKTAVLLSELEQCAVISCGRRETEGKIFYSATVAENGLFLGSNDAVHSTDGLDTSNSYGIFDLDFGPVGVLVGDDCLYPEAARALCDAGARLLIAVRGTTTQSAVTMARSHAVANGVRLLYCAKDYGFAADYNGKTTQFLGRVVTVDCALYTHNFVKYGRNKNAGGVSVYSHK